MIFWVMFILPRKMLITIINAFHFIMSLTFETILIGSSLCILCPSREKPLIIEGLSANSCTCGGDWNIIKASTLKGIQICWANTHCSCCRDNTIYIVIEAAEIFFLFWLLWITAARKAEQMWLLMVIALSFILRLRHSTFIIFLSVWSYLRLTPFGLLRESFAKACASLGCRNTFFQSNWTITVQWCSISSFLKIETLCD